MALVVEDGTGLETANSYITEADADTYVTERVVGSTKTTWDAASATEKESALIRASAYLDENYVQCWKGKRIVRTQGLDWPRNGVQDNDGYTVDSDAVPVQLARATVEVAVNSVGASAVPLTSENTQEGTIRRELVAAGNDAVENEIEYASPASGVQSIQQRFPKVNRMLSDLIFSTNRTRLG